MARRSSPLLALAAGAGLWPAAGASAPLAPARLCGAAGGGPWEEECRRVGEEGGEEVDESPLLQVRAGSVPPAPAGASLIRGRIPLGYVPGSAVMFPAFGSETLPVVFDLGSNVPWVQGPDCQVVGGEPGLSCPGVGLSAAANNTGPGTDWSVAANPLMYGFGTVTGVWAPSAQAEKSRVTIGNSTVPAAFLVADEVPPGWALDAPQGASAGVLAGIFGTGPTGLPQACADAVMLVCLPQCEAGMPGAGVCTPPEEASGLGDTTGAPGSYDGFAFCGDDAPACTSAGSSTEWVTFASVGVAGNHWAVPASASFGSLQVLGQTNLLFDSGASTMAPPHDKIDALFEEVLEQVSSSCVCKISSLLLDQLRQAGTPYEGPCGEMGGGDLIQGVGAVKVQCPGAAVADWPTWSFTATDVGAVPTSITLPPQFYVTDVGDGTTAWQYQPAPPGIPLPGILLGTEFLNAHYTKYKLVASAEGSKGPESVSFMSDYVSQ